MNIVALITFVSAAGGLLHLAVRLIGYASDFQGAAVARLPVIFTRAAATASSAASRCRMGVRT